MAENPPAFPQQCADALDVGMVHEGMNLRDWFAGQALAGMLASMADDQSFALSFSRAAPAAYKLADAMLAERERGQ